jgi:hypothetical protein
VRDGDPYPGTGVWRSEQNHEEDGHPEGYLYEEHRDGGSRGALLAGGRVFFIVNNGKRRTQNSEGCQASDAQMPCKSDDVLPQCGTSRDLHEYETESDTRDKRFARS